MCRSRILIVWILCGLLLPALARAASPSPDDFQPDPYSVQRHGPAYRYPQAGWIVLHIEGEPYERGYQHGRLLSGEIAGNVRCLAAVQNSKAPVEGWKQTRSLVNALFLRRYEKEFLEEMRGIADGASAAGARFDKRPIDIVDIVALNSWPEIETLPSALEATPTGLEGMRFPHAQPRALPDPKPMHCSAFAATGSATADGKTVFGHITMFGLYPSSYYNVWLDIKPTHGQRVLMQSYPGGIQSGLDYYMNDAGLLVCETTLAQTRFDIEGMCVASRIRQALQYADSIDKAVEILKKGNNGLYTNEWLLADIKTNEIAMFELGTHKSKLYRSSKNEWFGGTEGFYWGCNNAKDIDVRLETIPSIAGRPANVVFRPSERDKVWLRLFAEHRGKIDVAFGKKAFTTPPIAAYHSLDAKFTTTALAKDLKTWALFGPPLGRTWQPTQDERQRYPEVRPLVSNPWAVLHAQPPAKVELARTAVDLRASKEQPISEREERAEEERRIVSQPAWHGTVLPRSDADIWLAAAFADYERYVAQEQKLSGQTKDGKLSPADRDQLAVALFGQRSNYLAAARIQGDVPLADTRSELTRDEWYRRAAGKGVLLLHELRQRLGAEQFDKLMDAFGRENAGKTVTVAQFQTHVEKAAGQKLDGFFAYWVKQTGLPKLELTEARITQATSADAEAKKTPFLVEGVLRADGGPLPLGVDVTVESAKGEETRTVAPEPSSGKFTIESSDRPLRVVVDKYQRLGRANGGMFSATSFYAELERSLIVYGTQDEVATNREAAEALQRAIIERHANYSVPIKSDKDVTEADLKSHHLLLIGRPDSNSVIQRFQKHLPIRFGSHSFMVRQQTYAHPESAVVVAASNPLNPRYSLVVVAGLGGASTLKTAAQVPKLGGSRRSGGGAGEVVVLANGAKPRSLTVAPPELVRELQAR